MNKVFDKIIEKLKEEKMSYFLTIANTGDEKLDCAYEHTGDALDKAIKIVNQAAEQFGTNTNVGSKRYDVLEFANLLKELCCKKDEDYDNPVISPKYLNDTIENLLLDFNEQYNNGWIPCSEQLPKEDEKVYISTKTERVYVGVYTKRYGFEKREGFICDDGFMWMNTALAWKPYVLPAPYQPKGEIDECRNG